MDRHPAADAAHQEAPHRTVVQQHTQAFAPGSQGAYERGCTCPRLDNAFGRGVEVSLVTTLWWTDAACPYHVPPAPAPELS